MERQDWRVLTRIRTEPATALVVSVLLGSVITFALYGMGKKQCQQFSARLWFRYQSAPSTVYCDGSRSSLRACPVSVTIHYGCELHRMTSTCVEIPVLTWGTNNRSLQFR